MSAGPTDLNLGAKKTMPQAGRVGDMAQCSTDEHGGELSMTGEAISGSPDVLINGRAALRAGDPGVQVAGAGPSTWMAGKGSTGVFINGQPAFRHGDATLHDGTEGELVEGSPDVLFGEALGTTKARPHDRTVTLNVTDALERPIEDVVVSVFCPHEQREDIHVHGTGTISGLCSAAVVTVHKPLQVGEWDEGVSPMSALAHHKYHQLALNENGGLGEDGAAAAKMIGGASGTGGASATGTGGTAAKKMLVQAPAKAATATEQQSGFKLLSADGGTEVTLPTVHNWVELIYRAFGHKLPTGPREVALLGVREASLRTAVPGAHLTVDTREKEAREGDLDAVSFTREHKAPTYNDLLFCVWTDKNVATRQHVDVFECSIDASPGPELLHLPFLREGKLFHARPGAFKKGYPGKNITLHVWRGKKEKQEPKGTTAARVLQLAMKERGTTENPYGSNRTKYGAWYGFNGVAWCAIFVSWVFARAGMPQIKYAGCIVGADEFQKGNWGTWHSGGSRAEPGDIVFYNFPGEATYDHTGIVVKDNGSSITTVEGNTSSGTSGSQSNGGGVYLRTRPKDGTIIGYGRVKFQKPEKPLRSFIRWGGKANKVHKSFAHSTVLHHHYFKTEKDGDKTPDPAAARYRRFMQIYNRATNKKQIPYLIVSSRYIKTYSEWVEWITAQGIFKPGRRSVILESGLRSPKGHPEQFVPSFMSKAYADKVLARVRDMNDRHKAAKLRAALEKCLFKLKI